MVHGSKLLVCNTDSHGHTDYGLPISVHLGNDYRTMYKKSHEWLSPVGQDLDSRVYKKISHLKNLCMREEMYNSDFSANFPARAVSKNPNQKPKPPFLGGINYVTTFEHRLFMNPPPPIVSTQSEAKAAYTVKQAEVERRIVYPPDPFRICAIRAFGRDEQPPLVPEQPGFMKNLDIYLTTNRADYVPYSEREQRGIACKDIVTFYDASGFPRGKGYGPRRDTKIEPLYKKPKTPYVPPNKRKAPMSTSQTIPNRGYKPEYKEHYQPQTLSAMQPYGELLAVASFKTVPRQSPWQALAPPAMYCTEACHIGTGYPVNATVGGTATRRPMKHTIHVCA